MILLNTVEKALDYAKAINTLYCNETGSGSLSLKIETVDGVIDVDDAAIVSFDVVDSKGSRVKSCHAILPEEIVEKFFNDCAVILKVDDCVTEGVEKSKKDTDIDNKDDLTKFLSAAKYMTEKLAGHNDINMSMAIAVRVHKITKERSLLAIALGVDNKNGKKLPQIPMALTPKFGEALVAELEKGHFDTESKDLIVDHIVSTMVNGEEGTIH